MQLWLHDFFTFPKNPSPELRIRKSERNALAVIRSFDEKKKNTEDKGMVTNLDAKYRVSTNALPAGLSHDILPAVCKDIGLGAK